MAGHQFEPGERAAVRAPAPGLGMLTGSVSKSETNVMKFWSFFVRQ